MLTRFVRIQLAIFTIVSIIGVLVMLFGYVRVPTFFGIGRIDVTMELPGTGGLYRFSNVTYRGITVGTVTDVHATATGAQATLSLGTSWEIPADLQAQVHSMSAVGEQYVELLPRTNSGPYLRDGSLIPLNDTTIPQSVGPMVNQVSALIESIPKENLGALLDESYKGLDGAGYDLGSLLDSSAQLAHDINGVADRSRTLLDDSVPLFDAQASTTDATTTWARSLAGITDQLVTNDPQVRTLLRTGPGFADEVSRLLNQVKPTLPVLLANLVSVGRVTVTYNPSLRQLLVLLPPTIASTQSFGLSKNNPQGMIAGDASVQVEPPTCTVGFLPPSSWRLPQDTTDIPTPDGLYCKLPQDSPIAVRGARNYPCMGHPGKRAPTAAICNSDRPFEPLAMRQHMFGPYPIDPNLVAQGVPLDDRVDTSEGLYAPVEGTPMPPAAPAPDAAVSPQVVVPFPVQPPEVLPRPAAGDVPPTPPAGDPGPIPVAPSAFVPGTSEAQTHVATAQYDPHTGAYIASDGRLYEQTELSASSGSTTWKDLLPK